MHPSPDVLALLALGEEAGTPAERAHLESCPECRAELAGLARAVTAGRRGVPDDGGLVTPPDRVWQAIRAELGFTGQAGAPAVSAELPDIASVTALPRPAGVETNGAAEPPATVTPISAAPSRTPRGRRALALVVAAAVALVLALGLGLGLDRVLGPRERGLWTAICHARPSFAGSTGEAEVVADADGNRTLVIKLDSPEPVEGSRAVWLIDRQQQQMRFLGYLRPDGGSWPVPADLDPRQFPVVDVSKEPPGDPDPRHSQVSIVRGTLNV